MSKTTRVIGRGVGGAALVLSLLASPSAGAEDSCREWRGEHGEWKIEALRRYLKGAPQPEVDSALFELLQREAYLTSCETSVQGGRDELVAWRLVDREPQDYGSAVAESVLDRAGFDVDLRDLFAKRAPDLVASVPGPRDSRRHRDRSR